VNEDVLICINAPFMTQRVLKPWWRWTYQISAVKLASARAILGWVTSCEVWFGEPKADNIVSLGVGHYTYRPNGCTLAACNFHNKDWRPDGCNSSPCLALSRIAFGRCRPDVRAVAIVFPYLCLRRKSFSLLNIDWRPDGIATSSGRMHLNAGFFSNSEGRSDVLLRRPDGCKLEQ